MLSIVAAAVVFAVHIGSVLFTGSSYPVGGCQSFAWVQGDTTKGGGVNRVSPCSAGVY